MQSTLEKLDAWLKQNRQAYYAQLLPGAGEADFLALEQLLNLALPESFKDFYRWRNGQLSGCSEAFHSNRMLLGIEEIGETWQLLTDLLEGGEFEIPNWRRKTWLPLIHDGGGNYLCLDLAGAFTGQAGQLLEFWHDGYDREIPAS